MHGPAASVATVVASLIVLVPLAVYLGFSHAGPALGAGVAALVLVLVALGAETVRSLRNGRM